MGAEGLWTDAVLKFQPRAKEAFYPLLFLPNDFQVPDSEQFLELYQGTDSARVEYPSLVDFAAATLFSFLEDTFATKDFAAVAIAVRLKDLSGDSFRQQLSTKIDGLKSQPAFMVDELIVRAYQLFDDWNFLACVAETSSNYYAFYWETTA